MSKSGQRSAANKNSNKRNNNNWIQTYTGKKAWPLDIDIDDICIEDIAHSLSNICRFNGHCREFYSVAQHSVIVSRNCNFPNWGLMHDSAEAYLSDLSSPIKSTMHQYLAAEMNILNVMSDKFGLVWPTPPEVFSDIHRADLIVLATEQRDLMASKVDLLWPTLDGIDPLPMLIIPQPPSEAKWSFLNRFEELFS